LHRRISRQTRLHCVSDAVVAECRVRWIGRAGFDGLVDGSGAVCSLDVCEIGLDVCGEDARDHAGVGEAVRVGGEYAASFAYSHHLDEAGGVESVELPGIEVWEGWAYYEFLGVFSPTAVPTIAEAALPTRNEPTVVIGNKSICIVKLVNVLTPGVLPTSACVAHGYSKESDSPVWKVLRRTGTAGMIVSRRGLAHHRPLSIRRRLLCLPSGQRLPRVL
jgi:hypothetical protein